MKKNKNILITGSSKGIGLSTAKILSEEGHNVFITGRNEAQLVKLVKNFNFAGCFAVDLFEETAAQNLCKKVIDTLGTIDVLINNAGAYIYNPIEKTGLIEIKKLLYLNIEVPFILNRIVTPDMKKQKWGRIINIGSISGVVGEGNASLYSATKSALIGMTKSLALELAQYNITVNCVNPGWVDTELITSEPLSQDFTREEIIDIIPQKRFVHPDEVAALCKYLISDDAKGLTGQSINLCAGLSVG